MNKYGYTRSMSKKGCSPDNSACEGFFGRMKNEMFYGRNFVGVTIETFVLYHMVQYQKNKGIVGLFEPYGVQAKSGTNLK